MIERTMVVHADVDGSLHVVGRLTAIAANEREEAHLELDPRWQKTSHHRLLQPMLRCLRGPHLGGGTMPLFGAIGDSAPDRWGRTLMRRAERKRAGCERRPPRVLSEMDFLLGVRDEIRAGCLRFAEHKGGPYSGQDGAPIPSVDALDRLLDVIRAHERDEETPAQTRLLLETGQLLGGSRPKASVRDRDGHLLIAKFPSRGDPRDMQRWEALALTLAHECGICVPAFGVARVKGCSVMLTRRFDREEGSGRRMPFVSMLGLLGADDNKSQSYARMAEVVREIGSRPRCARAAFRHGRALRVRRACRQGRSGSHGPAHAAMARPRREAGHREGRDPRDARRVRARRARGSAPHLNAASCKNAPTSAPLAADDNGRVDRSSKGPVYRPERWVPLLQSCDSETELVRVLRDFLATVPPADLAAIPAGAGIASFDSALDVAAIAVSLAREELLFSGDEASRELLNSVTTVFATAATRLAEIQSQRLRNKLA